ncbi:MAG TPA: peptidoglycan editing factor PgeF [Candidatus Omnitrophica bacterium]|nr:peptidoglycan editing factor PgeF [Candidatus Omnitrophota bacterium]
MPEPLILKKQDGFYELCFFEKHGVRAVFTSRKYDMGFKRLAPGNAGGRKEAYLKLGINWKRLACPLQVHGDNVFVAQEKHNGSGVFGRSGAIADTDAIVTLEAGLPLAILTADCLPVFILDPHNHCIALVHAGWRGVYQRLIGNTIAKMGKVCGSAPEHLLVALGPAIRQCCYEVGKDFTEKFRPEVLKHSGGKLYFDSADEACRQMTELGIRRENICDSRICTSCANDEFFSFRREGQKAGRSMSVMQINRIRDII